MSRRQFNPGVRTVPKYGVKPKPPKNRTVGSEERFRAIVDSSRNWEYLVEPTGRLGYFSLACEPISGYSAEELEARPEMLDAIL